MRMGNFIVDFLMSRVLKLAKFANEVCVMIENWDEDHGWV